MPLAVSLTYSDTFPGRYRVGDLKAECAFYVKEFELPLQCFEPIFRCFVCIGRYWPLKWKLGKAVWHSKQFGGSLEWVSSVDGGYPLSAEGSWNCRFTLPFDSYDRWGVGLRELSCNCIDYLCTLPLCH